MTKLMLVDALHPEETRVVITSNGAVEEFDFITNAKQQIKGNIYLAKVTRVEPSLQAAFVEYGGERQGFLSFSEIHPDYYQIPIADRKRLIAEEEQRAEEAERREAEESEPTEDAGPDEGAGSEEGERPRGGRRRRRRTFGAKTREARATDISTQSEPIPAEAGDDAAAERPEGAETSPEKDEPAETPSTIETASEEEEIEQRRKTSHTGFARRYKIQEVIKRGQILLVQVIKEERGNKGVSLTTYISLAGRYCVLMPNASKEGGISRKISRGEDRKRLREIAAELKTMRGMSAIIRTAGIDRTKAEIKRDYEYLIKLWNHIREDALAATAPALIYEENNILKRSIRDYYTPDIEHVHVQGEEAFKSIRDMMKMIMPSHAARVKQHKDDVPIFNSYRVESQLQSMYQPTARLRSGGYLVINHTEALIAIDVNSGRSTTERNVEETALKTNLEAATEIARQLRLRDLGGLIVIDFIDMFYGKNRRSVERTFKDALRSDRAKIQVGHISPFGLLELSRQRLRPSIGESTTITCPHCDGSGFVRSLDSLAIEIVRLLENEASSGLFRELRVSVHPDLALFMLNHSRAYLSALEETHKTPVLIRSDAARMPADYHVEKIRKSDEGDGRREYAGGRDGGRHRGGRGGGRRDEAPRGPRYPEPRREGREESMATKEPPRDDTPLPEEDAEPAPEAAPAEENGGEEEGYDAGRQRGGRRHRGRRGGRGRGGRGRERDDAPREASSRPAATAHDAITGERMMQTVATPARDRDMPPPPMMFEPLGEEADGTPRRGWWRKIMEKEE